MKLTTIITKLKKHIKKEKGKIFDLDVSRELGIPSATFASQKMRNNIPYEEIIRFCKRNNIDMNDIFSGSLV